MPGLADQARAQLAADERDLMTPAEVAAALQISEKTLANQRSRRVGLPYAKLSGGIVRYSRTAVRKYVAERTVDHGGAA